MQNLVEREKEKTGANHDAKFAVECRITIPLWWGAMQARSTEEAISVEDENYCKCTQRQDVQDRCN